MKLLYIIHGEEELFRFEALDSLRKQAKQENFLNREVLTVDTHFKWNELWYSLKSQGLFSERKLLEIHIPNGKPGKVGGEQLQLLASKVDKLQDISIIIFLPKLDKTQLQSKWFKSLSQVADVHEAKTLYVKQLPGWISERLARHHLKIEQEALLFFAERVEGNLLAANQEIEKMSLLYPANTTISLAEAQLAVANVARFDIFQMSEAWMSGDIMRLLRLLEGLQLNDAEPLLVLWLISEDIRTLFRLSAALRQGKNIASVRNSLRLWGNKQLVAPKAVQRVSTKRLIVALQECSYIDRQIKGLEPGDFWVNIKNLLVGLCA